MMESEEEPKALPKAEEAEDDLDRKKERKPENQASGLRRRLEEKYPAPGGKGKPERETEDDLERRKEKKPENQVSGMQETERLLQGEQMEEKYQEGKPEKIIFTLHSAKDLANMDYMGKSDPYAILTYGSQERRTTTINNNLNPTWNHQVTFDYEENVSTIDIEIFDEDTMARDDSLGRLSIDVAEIKRNKTVVDAEARFEKSSSGSIKYSAELVTSSTSLSPSAQIVSSQRTVTSVKRTVDDLGNAVSEETETRTLEGV